MVILHLNFLHSKTQQSCIESFAFGLSKPFVSKNALTYEHFQKHDIDYRVVQRCIEHCISQKLSNDLVYMLLYQKCDIWVLHYVEFPNEIVFKISFRIQALMINAAQFLPVNKNQNLCARVCAAFGSSENLIFLKKVIKEIREYKNKENLGLYFLPLHFMH